MVSLGSNIRAERVRRDLTQGDLCDAVGISKKTLVGIEADEISPRVELVQAIAQAIDVPISRLIPDQPLPTPPAQATANGESAIPDPTLTTPASQGSSSTARANGRK